MASEAFLATALPYSLDATAPFHVSVVITPRLAPSGPRDQLGSFPTFSNWTEALGRAHVVLRDQDGDVGEVSVVDAADPDLWPRVFPPTTPVAGFEPARIEGRDWRTFSVAAAVETVEHFHLATVLASPTEPPSPLRSPLLGGLLAVLAQQDMGFGARDRDWRYDESRVARMLDEHLERARSTGFDARAVNAVAEGADARAAVIRGALHLHAARRFYERRDPKQGYRRDPDPSLAKPRPERPVPDFHQRCVYLANQPALMRRLGLVVDLAASDVARLAAAEWLAVDVAVPVPDAAGATVTGHATKSACSVVAGHWVVTPRTQDWNAGRLRLGDASAYRVVDVDADGAALKHDRYLWTLPRLVRSALPRDMVTAMKSGKPPLPEPVDAATPALRSPGFTIARNGRLADVRSNINASIAAGTRLFNEDAAPLVAEDVTRGVRVEVWDATEKRWFTLHARHGAVTAPDGRPAGEFDDEGWVQGTTAATRSDEGDDSLGVHESVFGWDGWSLSAPRPGRTIPIDAGPGNEVADRRAEGTPVVPVTDMTVQPFTLPRLRYGRSYAFRAWAVDLAGNSVPHTLDGPLVEAPTASLVRNAEAHSLAAAGADPPLVGTDLGGALRSEVRRALRGETPGDLVPDPHPRRRRSASDASLPRLPELRRIASARTARQARRTPGGNQGRADLVRRAVERAIDRDERSLVNAIASRWDAERLAEMLAGAARRPGQSVAEALADITDTVTIPRPFLRWDPVLAPVAVPRRPYTEGESLQRLVIRSGVEVVDGGAAGMSVELVDAATFAASTVSTPAYHGTCERHLAPPKTSQLTAELHGMFDLAIGEDAASAHKKMLGWALREAGTFQSERIADLARPGETIEQAGIELVATPATPASTLRTLAEVQSGDPVAPGQYVVHDIDTVQLPYLPDPLAVGLTLWFVDAGSDRPLTLPHGAETLTLRYDGPWPALQPLRLVVESAPQVTARLDGSVLAIGMPPGDTLRFRLSSSLDADGLDLLAVWRALPDEVRGDADVVAAATDGLWWSLTPSEEYVLVHAVPRPVEAPRPTRLDVEREEGSNVAWLHGGVDCHGPSTGRLDCEATWTEWVDDVTLPGLEKRPASGLAFTTDLDPDEDIVVLDGSEDRYEEVPGAGTVRVHAATHAFGDTRHRMVEYRFRGHTRFQEYFSPEVLDRDPGRGVVGPTRRVAVPSSARPAAPLVDSVIPLFRWDEAGEPEQPVATRRSRRSGLRVYLQRPWYSSGEGELLGVIVAPERDESGLVGRVTQWGADPVWRQKGPERRPMLAELDDFLHLAGYDDRPRAGRPVRLGERLPLVDVAGRPEVTVLGYEPWFNEARGLWAVDIAIDTASAFWPFVRLAVARFQPESVDGCHLSDVVLCDFAQLAPERTATIGRPDARHVRIVVSGPVGTRGRPREVDLTSIGRRVFARVERRVPGIGTDLGWETVAAAELPVRGFDADEWEAAWVGEIELPEEVPLRTPGTSDDWRVSVEEVEFMDADAVEDRDPPHLEARLVYADHLPL